MTVTFLFGQDEIGSDTAISPAGYAYSSSPFTLSSASYVNAIYARIKKSSTTSSFRVGIFSSSGGTLTKIVESALITAGSSSVAWQEIAIPRTLLGASTTYCIAIVASDTSVTSQRRYDGLATLYRKDISGTTFSSSFSQGDVYASLYPLCMYAALVVVVPTVTTQSCSSITATGAAGNGNITAIGSDSPTTRGFCYVSGTGTPTIANSKVSSTGTFGTGSFSQALGTLANKTLYTVRAFATSVAGTSYGSSVTVTTLATTPTVATQAVSSIGKTTATLNGNITVTGGESSTVRGFYYVEGTGTPTASDTVVSSTGTFNTGAYTESLTGLSSGTKYSVRAFATNTKGTSVGAVVQFTALHTAPTVTTQAASSISYNAATLNGNITNIGSQNATARGFYWLEGSSGTPTSANNVITASGSFGTGAYTGSMTGLDPFTSYRAVAFATNAGGTTTGDVINVTTTKTTPTVTTQACTSIEETTATLNGNITALGGDNATERGFYYKEGTTGTPTAADTKASDLGDFSTGAYTKDITGLTVNTAYRVISFATNSVGTATGTVVDLVTDTVPTTTTQAVSAIASTTATFNGNVTALGGDNVTEEGFYYKIGAIGDPTSADTKISTLGDFGTGAYTENVTGLTRYTQYRVVAFATNSVGTVTGSTVGFTSLEESPTVTTQAATNILGTTVTLNGNITDAGGNVCTARGFYYLFGTVGDPTAADAISSETGSFTEGAYTADITGLTKGASYRAAAFSTNAIGTTIGDTVDVVMLEDPTVTTDAVSDLLANSVTLNGTMSATGGINATERGFYWKQASSGDPTSADNTLSTLGDFGTGAFLESLTGLEELTDYRFAAFATTPIGTTIGATVGIATPNFKKIVSGTTGAMSAIIDELEPDTKYYIRAYAINSEGTAYSDETDFTTIKAFIPSIIIGN